MKLSVILVISFEPARLVEEALSSILASDVPFAYEVIVVDNASGAAASALAPYRDRLTVLRNAENLGFTRANNRGAAAARGEFLLFLNSDTRVFPDTLARLVAFAEAHPQAGAVGPLVLNGDGTLQLSCGRPFSLLSEFWHKAVLAPRARGADPGALKARAVGWVSGCCLLTRREWFPGGRVFDEEIFLYFDDSELCTRLRKEGRKVFFFPGARIVHYGGASVRSLPARTAVEYRRSQLHVYQKHLPQWQRGALKLYLRLKFRWKRLRSRSEEERSAAAQILELLRRRTDDQS
ncbi:MAG: glycosyltransferase family 2 protein [Candidatus Aminicenantes bacterium]|nr:glycosyltransferase family 2 protein [Candidatus Aminicenantes bacterium]